MKLTEHQKKQIPLNDKLLTLWIIFLQNTNNFTFYGIFRNLTKYDVYFNLEDSKLMKLKHLPYLDKLNYFYFIINYIKFVL